MTTREREDQHKSIHEPIDRLSRQILKKETSDLKLHCRSNVLNRGLQSILSNNSKMDMFTAAHGTFSKVDDILGHEANLNEYKIIEIISGTLSEYNRIK
jgi:hypothetical protein